MLDLKHYWQAMQYYFAESQFGAITNGQNPGTILVSTKALQFIQRLLRLVWPFGARCSREFGVMNLIIGTVLQINVS